METYVKLNTNAAMPVVGLGTWRVRGRLYSQNWFYSSLDSFIPAACHCLCFLQLLILPLLLGLLSLNVCVLNRVTFVFTNVLC
uniref:Uncharacterized protein n=1 Tax=Anguilla anguilla TaxID=7936 RepID=A0A0E9WVT0_ANGAN